MTLYDILMVSAYWQKFHVYVTNVYDQNIEIGHGTRREIVDEEITEEGIDHLMDTVETMRVCKDGSIVLRLVDKHYEECAETMYSKETVSRWDNLKPETRPWKLPCELEDFK